MIDTIQLFVRNKEIPQKNPNSTHFWQVYSTQKRCKKFILQPTRTQAQGNLYYPKVFGFVAKGSQYMDIKIEFSVPKLLYNNNLDEVDELDFDIVTRTLQARLQDLGLSMDLQEIRGAQVTSLHVSKNIRL